MGVYVNSGIEQLRVSKKNKFYVDKSMLISILNEKKESDGRFICVSRPRRFGKTMAANMIAAYYSKDCDSHEIFSDLKISKDPSFEENINKYTVIKLDINGVATKKGNMTIVQYCNKLVVPELIEAYPDLGLSEDDSIPELLISINKATEDKFVFIIDEYDLPIRDVKYLKELEDYIDFLVALFKSDDTNNSIALAYLTGIMPIIRDKVQSKLNNFTEYTMINAAEMAPFMGFTEDEVKSLALRGGMDFEDLKCWYDGYNLHGLEIYSPKSVITAVTNKDCDDYWSYTGIFTSLRDLILKDYAGTRRDVIQMISGGRVSIDPMKYNNSMTDIRSRDDVFTCLVHLGYLGFDKTRKECFIPNYEIKREWIRSIEDMPQYEESSEIVKNSDFLINAIWEGDEEAVAKGVKRAHMDISSNLTYNRENEFRCAVRYALCTADKYYTVVNEFPAGKGFADIVFIPHENNVPLIVVELKRDTKIEKALEQIKDREYPESLRQYRGNTILLGLSYSTDTKEHFCKIERLDY